jgi:hypothetical protein
MTVSPDGENVPRPTCDDDAVLRESAVLVDDDEQEDLYFFVFVNIGLNPASSCPIALGRFLHLAQ